MISVCFRTLCSMLLGALLLFGAASGAKAASPNCATEGGTLLSWPAVDPIWQLCWLPPSASVGPRGSGLELRAVHYRGILVAKRIHSPLLFAEYRNGSGGDCYRDWKDSGTPTLAHSSTHNQLAVPPDLSRLATTACLVSQSPTQSYGTCPFQQPTGGGYSCTGANGVVIEDLGDEVRLTTQYRADWYMYDSRVSFGADGTIEPTFGFGNNNGTFNNVTHWHHNYWRFDFYIDNQPAHIVATNGVDQTVEFSDTRGAEGSKTWSVRNPATGRGYQIAPQPNDYVVGTNESGRGFHTVDFMATRYVANEYGDRPDNDLGDCSMNQGALVNGASILNQEAVLYYRVAVRDTTSNNWPPGCGGVGNPCIPQDSMVCKTAGPRLVPFGDWGQGSPANADLSIAAVSDPATAAPGGSVQIDVTVSNAGPENSTNATVTLDLPAEFTLAGVSQGASDWSCANSGANEVSCSFTGTSIPASGQSSFSVELDVAVGAIPDSYDTVVTVTSTLLDTESGNNVATSTTSIVALPDEVFGDGFE